MYCGHTTCRLVVNENDPGLYTDMRGALQHRAALEIPPVQAPRKNYITWGNLLCRIGRREIL